MIDFKTEEEKEKVGGVGVEESGGSSDESEVERNSGAGD